MGRASASATFAIFCSRGSTTSAGTFTLFSVANSGFRWDYNRTTATYSPTEQSTKYVLTAKNDGLYLLNESTGLLEKKIDVTPAQYEPANQMTLFGSYTATPGVTPKPADNFAKLRLYSFRAYDMEDGELVLKVNLRPCVDADGNAALYDAVGRTLYKATASKSGMKMIAGGKEIFYDRPDVLLVSGAPEDLGSVSPVYGVTDGLAAGETVSYTGFPTITEVGEVTNEFEIVWGGVKESNYAVTKTYGVLTVRKVWGTCELQGKTVTSALPEGSSNVTETTVWFWRATDAGHATFDFGELDAATFAGAEIKFENREIEVDSFKVPTERNLVFSAAGANTKLVAKTYRSAFDVARAGTSNPVKPLLKAALLGATPASADGVTTWKDLAFTCDPDVKKDGLGMDGGAIVMNGGAFEIANCTFEDCFAQHFGGAVAAFMLTGDSVVTNSTFVGNWVNPNNGYGGAVYATALKGKAVTLTVADSAFTDNRAVDGGAIATMPQKDKNEDPLTLAVADTTFAGNEAGWGYSGNGGGYVFDCRYIHNPGKYEQYKNLTGNDAPVIEFLERDGEVIGFLENVYELADRHIRKYIERGFTHLMFSFGCTGGQHRSVYCANHLAEYIRSRYDVSVKLTHRELK